jgi:cysteine synthase A
MSYPNLITTVGRTPVVELARLAKNLPGRVFGKLEMRNPCGRVKDRVAVTLIEDAEARGTLKPGMSSRRREGIPALTSLSSPPFAATRLS